MARTVAQIQAEMDAAYQDAFGLTNDQMSAAGVWKLLRGIVALAIYTLEKLFDMFKAEIAIMAEAVEFGNFRWWKARLLAFQYGDPLIEQDGKLYYLAIDPAKQIIKKVSVVEESGILKFKIAGQDGSELVKITDAGERAAIDSYISDIKPAGVNTMVVSTDPDLLGFTAHFVFDGKLIQDDFESAVMAAIDAYLIGIDFDSQFRINRFRDTLEAIPGMIEVYINQVKWQAPDTVGFELIPLSANHQPISGYYKHEVAQSTLTYEPR